MVSLVSSTLRSQPESTYQQLALGLAAAALAMRGKVLPEQGVVDVTAAVEVQHGGLGGGGDAVVLGLGLADSLLSGVEAVDISLVVLRVMQLHDLAGDVRLECAVVVFISIMQVSTKFIPLAEAAAGRLTGKVGERSLATDEAGASHCHGRLRSLGAQAGAQGGSSSKEGGRHFLGFVRDLSMASAGLALKNYGLKDANGRAIRLLNID